MFPHHLDLMFFYCWSVVCAFKRNPTNRRPTTSPLLGRNYFAIARTHTHTEFCRRVAFVTRSICRWCPHSVGMLRLLFDVVEPHSWRKVCAHTQTRVETFAFVEYAKRTNVDRINSRTAHSLRAKHFVNCSATTTKYGGAAHGSCIPSRYAQYVYDICYANWEA